MSAFTLGRMRHLDLLALYFTLHTGDHGPAGDRISALSKEQIAAVILASTG